MKEMKMMQCKKIIGPNLDLAIKNGFQLRPKKKKWDLVRYNMWVGESFSVRGKST